MSDAGARRGDRAGQQNTKPQPNVKPKSGSLREERRGRREKRERDGKPLRRSRSSDTEYRDSRRRGRERERGERRERGRSEERSRHHSRHRRDPVDEPVDTECPVCFCTYDNAFKAPKLLQCGHTFCLECLARINVSSAELKALSCPVCRGLTEVRHGRDLPHLGTNQEVFRHLPPELQKIQSVRFKRSKGKLELKTAKHSLTLPTYKKQGGTGHTEGVDLGAIEAGSAPVTSVDVGAPPSRIRGGMRRLFRSNQCYYAIVGAIIGITVVLMLVGILAFVVVPTMQFSGNNSRPRPPRPTANPITSSNG